MKRMFAALALIIGMASVARAETPWCQTTPYYDAYPGTGSYPVGTPYTYGWDQYGFCSHDNQWDCASLGLLEAYTDRSASGRFDAVMGEMDVAYYFTSASHSPKLPSTTTDQIIAVLDSAASGRVMWNEVWVTAVFAPIAWQSGVTTTSGFSLLANYRSSDDFYIATFRHDGQVVLKRKLCGTYTTIGSAYYHSDHSALSAPGDNYRAQLLVHYDGSALNFTVKLEDNGVYGTVLTASDASPPTGLLQGAVGWRQDDLTTYLEQAYLTRIP